MLQVTLPFDILIWSKLDFNLGSQNEILLPFPSILQQGDFSDNRLWILPSLDDLICKSCFKAWNHYVWVFLKVCIHFRASTTMFAKVLMDVWVNMLHAWIRMMMYCWAVCPDTVCIRRLGSAHIRPDTGKKRWQRWKASSVAAMTPAGNMTFPVLPRALFWLEGWPSWPSHGEVGLCGAGRGACFPLGVRKQILCFCYSPAKFKKPGVPRAHSLVRGQAIFTCGV